MLVDINQPYHIETAKILMDNLMLGVELANVLTRCFSHPRGKSEVRCENDGNLKAWLLNAEMHATRGMQGNLPSWSISGISNIK